MTRQTDFATYDEDFFAWTQDQASALRRLQQIAQVGRSVDIEHVAEEIEDLGRRELREVKSLLARVLEHFLKIALDPGCEAVSHWRAESLVFQRDAFNAFSPSMRQHLDLDDLWSHARRVAAARTERDVGSLPVPQACPISLDDVLAQTFDLDHALASVASASEAGQHRD